MAKRNGSDAPNAQGGLMERVGRWLQPRQLGEEMTLPAAVRQGPVVDVKEDKNQITVKAELPGLDKHDFSVELDNHRLILRGEKKLEREENEEDYFYSERSFGSFYRTVPLPCEVVAEEVKADYRQGVLTITLPKSESAKTNRVKVNVS